MLRPHPTHSFDTARTATAIAAAGARAAGLRRSLKAQRTDEQDFRQAILLDLMVRSQRFDETRGPWSAFVSVITRNAATDIAHREVCRRSTTVLGGDHEYPDETGSSIAEHVRIDLKRAIEKLPPQLAQLIQAIARAGEIRAARRATGMPPARFYRALADLRRHLIREGAVLNRGRRFEPPPIVHRSPP